MRRCIATGLIQCVRARVCVCACVCVSACVCMCVRLCDRPLYYTRLTQCV